MRALTKLTINHLRFVTQKNPTPKTMCLRDEIWILAVPPQLRRYVTISASSSTPLPHNGYTLAL